MTIEDIRTRKEGQTFDRKSILVEPKALAVPIVAMANADGGLLANGEDNVSVACVLLFGKHIKCASVCCIAEYRSDAWKISSS